MMVCSSCRTPQDVVYFQDITSETTAPVNGKSIVVQPNDRLMIMVNARDRDVSEMFNLSSASRTLGNGGSYNSNQGVAPYIVSARGDIDFPFLGVLHVAGMNRSELAGFIKGQLEAKGLAIDPIITVDFLNAGFSVLGEVNNPGRYSIARDEVTILDALAMAGDMTINGKRENVRLLRTENGVQKTYILNLLSDEELRNSPAYYLQQEDVIYVEPNPTRVRQSQLNANTVLTPSFWISIASFGCTLTALLLRF